MKNYKDYKKEKSMTEAYRLASSVQENYAFISNLNAPKKDNKYEGHLAVIDVLNKIDAMIRMFECSMKDKSATESNQKMTQVISALYELAQAKLIEAKTECIKYLDKTTGIPSNGTTELTPSPSSEVPAEEPVDKENSFQ